MRNRMQVAGIAGVIFVVAVLASLFLGGDPPAPDDTAEVVKSYFVDNRDGILAATFAQLIGAVAFLWFLSAVVDIASRGRDGDLLGRFVFAGGLVALTLALVGQAILAAPVYVEGAVEQHNKDLLHLIFQGQMLVYMASSAAIVVALGGMAVAGLRDGVMAKLPSWLAAIGAGAALVGFGGAFEPDIGFVGFLAFLVFLLFSLVLSIYMITGRVTVHGETPMATPGNA